MATIAKVLKGVNQSVHLQVARIVIGTCGTCDDAPLWCQCWNDE